MAAADSLSWQTHGSEGWHVLPLLSYVVFTVEKGRGLVHSYPVALVWGFSEQRVGPF